MKRKKVMSTKPSDLFLTEETGFEEGPAKRTNQLAAAAHQPIKRTTREATPRGEPSSRLANGSAKADRKVKIKLGWTKKGNRNKLATGPLKKGRIDVQEARGNLSLLLVHHGASGFCSMEKPIGVLRPEDEIVPIDQTLIESTQSAPRQVCHSR